MDSIKQQNTADINKTIAQRRKSIIKIYQSRKNSTTSMYGDIDFELDQNQDENRKLNREYLRSDALVYSAAFEEYIKNQKEKECNNQSQMNTLQISKLIDQAERKNLTLESPEILQQNFYYNQQ